MLSKSRIKYIQSLYHKKFRDEYAKFVIEGTKIVEEFLQQLPSQVESVYGTKVWMDQHQSLLRLVPAASIEEVSEDELKKLSALSNPGQVLAVIKKWESPISFASVDSITLMLDGIRDPGNMGTIIRIADWFGIKNIACSEDCVEIFNPKVVQATMGSILRVNVWYLDLNDWITKNSNVKIFACTMQGKSLYDFKPQREAVLLIGNESSGISESLLGKAHEQVTIPKKGQAESLNAAVATGIVVAHMVE